ncbi:MAG: tRNA (adenosine(37)-N6)-threonylcarbamoyltransferase complex ATPase subunit type 1 TsaE [Corynebacterium sp.]|nr:tRNA (adenosine(37)-N6)-threonylcarbamoyltransferase complex ATPase subunit type 1 TsaE [Corynebacterium sp.]
MSSPESAAVPEGTFRCPTVEDTWELGERIGAGVSAGDVIVLSGPLGAGKTALTQGIARGMGVGGRVTSPTFTIARLHRPTAATPDRPALIHVDAYRLLDSGDDPLDTLESLGLDEELDRSVVVAEWGEGMMEALSDRYYLVEIARAADDVRTLTITRHGGAA